MASFSRFNDESYKNWLKTTMSLQILKSSLGSFLENETETYHSSLRNELKGVICKSNCILKKQYSKIDDVCKDCQLWWKEILNNHNNKNGIIYWNNSKPYLWSSEKWEVAKVYMPKGNKDHNTVDQFDISAALNFMTFCSHFKKIVKEQVLKDVTHVRNQMMHSSDMKVAKKDMETHLKKIRELAKVLQDYCPELKDLQEKLIQLQKVDLNIMLEGPDSSREDIIKNILDVQKIQDLEQQVLKEKIECLASRLEEDKEPQRDKEFVGMKEFLDQNKDLLGQLGPQMEKLNTIQVKVEQHDKQLNILTGKVDQLEKNTNEPVFSVDTAKYKNHLFEKARENKWPEPVFENIRKPQGYTGQVVVNGQTFTGYHVHPNVKAAHQEVSMIALEQLSATQEGSSSLHTDQSASSTTSTANPLFFASVKVPVNTAFEGPEADSMEAAVQEAYRSLEQALTLGDTAAGSLSCSAREQIHDFFNQADCKLPEEKPVCSMESTFRCKLQISGDLTFQNPEGMSKKQHAEQAAAKEALDRLSGVLSWDLTGANGNYKGRLQELLAKLGKKPFYQPVYGPRDTESCSKRAASEETGTGGHTHATVSISNIETMETAHADTRQLPFIKKAKTELSAALNPTVQPTESNLTDSSDTDVQQGRVPDQVMVTSTPIHSSENSVSSANPLFFASVKVPVNTAFEGPEADSMEAAVQEAYRSLEQALTLGDTAAGSLTGSARERIHDFFNQADCKLPEEKPVCSMESTFRCKLEISGDLTFQNPEGMSKKQHAEQAAAKEALDRLSGVLSWDLTGANGNYKGRLQELLAKLGKKPFYQPVAGPSASETSKRGAATERHFDAVPQAAVSVSICETQETSPVYTSPIPSHRKKLKTESACANPTDCQSFAVPELEKLLIMFGLEPPSVSCECFSMETKFQCSAEIHLVNYTFQNQQGYSNKKDATRKTYLIFGKALGICGANIEENQATAAVKTYFNKNLLSLPSEEFFQKEEKTHCSLTVASWSFLFEGQGESEEAAKLDICCQALSVIGPLFGCELASRVSSRSAEERLALMLEVVGQRPPLFQQAATLHKATVQLHFNAFVLESKGQNNKKSAQRQLSMRILRLLGEEETGETSKDVNERNRLDDWFKKKRIPQPIFEDTEEVLGVKATFSCRVTCSHPDWQASTEVAMTRLKEELKRRFRNLADESADHGWSG